MIKIEDTDIFGWEAAIRGMRNPLNSWNNSDSIWCESYDYKAEETVYNFRIGKADLELMKHLIKAGTDHSKFMRMITVTCDIIAPLYWWKEFDTYKVGTVRNSCSTMHKIHEKEFTLDDFSCENLLCDPGSQLENVIEVGFDQMFGIDFLMYTVQALNGYREKYIKTKYKCYWWQMIQLLPSSYNQRATVQLSYQVLRNIYHSRKNHKLDEWNDFCNWIETLPYSELITGGQENEN